MLQCWLVMLAVESGGSVCVLAKSLQFATGCIGVHCLASYECKEEYVHIVTPCVQL